MKPLHVRFAEGWDLPEPISGIAPRLWPTVQALVEAKLKNSGDCGAETGPSAGEVSRELRSVIDYAEGTSLFIDWRFLTDESAEVLRVFRFPRLEDDAEEPPMVQH